MLLLTNGTVITHDEENRVIKNGAVLIDGEEIKALGEAELLKSKYPEAEVKDVEGKVIMPGMINTHMHIYSTFARGMDLKTEEPPRHFLEILEKMPKYSLTNEGEKIHCPKCNSSKIDYFTTIHDLKTFLHHLLLLHTLPFLLPVNYYKKDCCLHQ